MDNTTTRTLDWLTGRDSVPLTEERPMMRDGIWAVMGWRDLQDRPLVTPVTPFAWLIGLVIATFLFPLLAWSETQDLPVLKNRLEKGHIITAADLTSKPFGERFISARVIQEKSDLVGKEVYRHMNAGVPIFNTYVRVPPTIRKNTSVELVFSAPGIALTGTGRALTDAPTGQQVKVMNDESGKIVAGVALKDGRVLVQ